VVIKEAPPLAEHQWLIPVILATQEAEFKTSFIQIVQKTLSRKTHHKKGLVE
jgi:hypothetical protein